MSTGDKTTEKRRKESIIDLNKYLDKKIRVKFSGGREATGILKGCDNLQNMVLDCTTEFLRDPDDPHRLSDDTRELGLVVCSMHPVGSGRTNRGTVIRMGAKNPEKIMSLSEATKFGEGLRQFVLCRCLLLLSV